jgi:hypothetical protein
MFGRHRNTHLSILIASGSSCQLAKEHLNISDASSKVVELGLGLCLYVSELRLHISELRLHISELCLHISEAAFYRKESLLWRRDCFIVCLRFQAANEVVLLRMFSRAAHEVRNASCITFFAYEEII